MDTRRLTKQALVMALYITQSLALPELGFGPIQFRISEILTLMAFLDRGYVLPLTLACAIVNIWSPFGLVDVVFGSLASFLALYSMSRTKNIYLASIFPALFSFIIGLEILLLSQEPVNFFLVTGQIILSELVIVSLIGVGIFKVLVNNSYLSHMIKIND